MHKTPLEGALVMTEPRILIFVQWFGPWPEWMRCFLESCRFNPTVDWLMIGDAPPLLDAPPNVRQRHISFPDYRAHVASALGITPRWNDIYKVCDLKPTVAALFPEELEGYDHWGYCDLDVIFGDIRSFYTPEFLDADIIGTHTHVIGGHFVVARNTPRMVDAFRKIPFWKYYLSSAAHKSFDEQVFSWLFMPFPRGRMRRLLTPFLGGGRFVEQFSTNIAPLPWIDGTTRWPEEWYFDRGRLTTNRSGDRQFLYLHFSHWQSNRWTSESVAPWKKLETLVVLPPGPIDRFVVSREGFKARPDEKRSAAA